jgi:hypothetical protein
MSNENLDHLQALERAATLIDKNSAEFDEELQSRNNTLYKSRHMVELNKARAKWQVEHEKELREKVKGGWEDGENWVRENEHHWRIPCSVCGREMYFSSEDEDFAGKYKVLKEAFKNWRHADCESKGEE